MSMGIFKQSAAITTAADGTATVVLATRVNGYLVGWNTDSGDLTNLWDFTVTTQNSDADIALGAGANQPATDEVNFLLNVATFGTINFRVPVTQDDVLTVNVTNGGNAKSGTVYFYFERY